MPQSLSCKYEYPSTQYLMIIEGGGGGLYFYTGAVIMVFSLAFLRFQNI